MVLIRNNLKLIKFVLGIQNTKLSRSISVCSGCWKQNHYKILGVSESCTESEIKKAFLEKIKLLHPDRNAQNPKNHDLVIAVNEAYGVLSKVQRRAFYDQQLMRERGRYFADSIETEYYGTPFRDDSLWEFRDRREDSNYRERPYYGIKGINRLPNTYVAAGVIIFTIVAAVIHYYLAKFYTSYALKKLSQRSAENIEFYREVRERALRNGTIKQLDLLRENNGIPPNINKVSEK